MVVILKERGGEGRKGNHFPAEKGYPVRVYHVTLLWVTFARHPAGISRYFSTVFHCAGKVLLAFTPFPLSLFCLRHSQNTSPAISLSAAPVLFLRLSPVLFPGICFSASQKPPSHPLVLLQQCHPIDCSLCLPHPSFPVIFTLLACTSRLWSPKSPPLLPDLPLQPHTTCQQ